MNNIKWLIQSVGKNQMLEDNFETVKKLKFDYDNFSLITGKNEIINLENFLTNEEDNYILRGGTKIISLFFSGINDLEKLSNYLTENQIKNKDIFYKKLKEGIFYDEINFDQEYYNKLDLPLLNKNSVFISIKDNKELSFDNDYFIKPSKDLKSFLPGILKAKQKIKDFIESGSYIQDYDKEMLLVSPVEKLYNEYRFFIINKEVITYSQYRNENEVKYNSFVPKKMVDIAKEYAKLYQPHEIFTMDLVETDNGVKIVEYNCWNGSGLYHCDKIKLFKEVNDFIKNKCKVKNKNGYI